MDSERSRTEQLTIMTSEIIAVTSFLNSSTTLFTAPATLIGVQIFLFLQVGVYGLALVTILVITAVIQIWLKGRMAVIKKQKDELIR